MLASVAGLRVLAETRFVTPQALSAEGAYVTPDVIVYVEPTTDRLSHSATGARAALRDGHQCFPAGARAFLIACTGGSAEVRRCCDLPEM